MPADDDLDLDDLDPDDPDGEGDPEGQQQRRNPLRDRARKLEKENRELRKQQADAEKATREAAFLRAGIDPDDPKQSYFVRGYEGETTPDAIRAAAVEGGFLEPAEPLPDAAQHAAVGAAGTGGVPSRGDTGEPRFVQDEEGYKKALAGATSQEDVLDVMSQWGSPSASRIIGD